MSRNKNVSYSKYVHEFTDATGAARYAVGEWNENNAQYTCPLDAGEREATGCHTKFSKTPAGLGGYTKRAKALRRARYLYGEQSS
jgi:hypothetical protein